MIFSDLGFIMVYLNAINDINGQMLRFNDGKSVSALVSNAWNLERSWVVDVTPSGMNRTQQATPPYIKMTWRSGSGKPAKHLLVFGEVPSIAIISQNDTSTIHSFVSLLTTE